MGSPPIWHSISKLFLNYPQYSATDRVIVNFISKPQMLANSYKSANERKSIY
ncbi:hypothetical protein CODIS_12630 [Candidatus Thiodiazotropha endolucinida]|uniref:Uncharacterized protein n=1 Tax=Candidatus Thiodiazotropha endolucinida TaxID=1655433 RepID=A0A7Z0VM87_9GAMM|nr:hypothetical protein CODIS_12630 [Candidatus Thiodiazotropha endolucinida]